MRRILPLMLFSALLMTAASAGAHCEVPCGIYDDQMRVEMIREHADTIEKAMNQIGQLDDNPNQQVRWITTKEDHAEQAQHVIWQYFMTQRIKPDMDGYTEKLTLLHHMLRDAMKCKQTTDPAHAQALRDHLAEFEKIYFAGHEH